MYIETESLARFHSLNVSTRIKRYLMSIIQKCADSSKVQWMLVIILFVFCITYFTKRTNSSSEIFIKTSIQQAAPASFESTSIKTTSSEQGTDQAPLTTFGNIMKKNLMFIKTHKCGTSTLVNVFYLYGVRHRSNFALQPYKHNINSIDTRFTFFHFYHFCSSLFTHRPFFL